MTGATPPGCSFIMGSGASFNLDSISGPSTVQRGPAITFLTRRLRWVRGGMSRSICRRQTRAIARKGQFRLLHITVTFADREPLLPRADLGDGSGAVRMVRCAAAAVV